MEEDCRHDIRGHVTSLLPVKMQSSESWTEERKTEQLLLTALAAAEDQMLCSCALLAVGLTTGPEPGCFLNFRIISFYHRLIVLLQHSQPPRLPAE